MQTSAELEAYLTQRGHIGNFENTEHDCFCTADAPKPAPKTNPYLQPFGDPRNAGLTPRPVQTVTAAPRPVQTVTAAPRPVQTVVSVPTRTSETSGRSNQGTTTTRGSVDGSTAVPRATTPPVTSTPVTTSIPTPTQPTTTTLPTPALADIKSSKSKAGGWLLGLLVVGFVAKQVYDNRKTAPKKVKL